MKRPEGISKARWFLIVLIGNVILLVVALLAVRLLNKLGWFR